MLQQSTYHLLARIQELESRLEESEQLIDAIKQGEVDAFAIRNNQDSEVYTLHSGDYAYRVLIEEFEEGAINVTEEGLIVYTNPYFCRLLNLRYEKVIGSSLFDFVHPDSIKEFEKLFSTSTEGKSKGEINLLSNDVTIPVYISLTSLQPKLPTVGIIITDFTGKKKNESLILDYQKNLENKNKELIQSNSELASFAYIASHDLQEPLRKIQTFANHIGQKEAQNLSDVGRNHFGRIQMSAKRMQALIEDLLVYSRTNSVERRFVYTSFNKVVDEVLEDMKEELVQKGAKVQVGPLCHAWLIPFQFRQLIQNLLNNSLKFTAPGTIPTITISSIVAPGAFFQLEKLNPNLNYCHLTVADNGIGFEQQYSEIVFDLFQRLHSKAEYKGTGIGLAIVKKIVDNHNGFITVDAELNKGATFHIYIPATRT